MSSIVFILTWNLKPPLLLNTKYQGRFWIWPCKGCGYTSPHQLYCLTRLENMSNVQFWVPRTQRVKWIIFPSRKMSFGSVKPETISLTEPRIPRSVLEPTLQGMWIHEPTATISARRYVDCSTLSDKIPKCWTICFLIEEDICFPEVFISNWNLKPSL